MRTSGPSATKRIGLPGAPDLSTLEALVVAVRDVDRRRTRAAGGHVVVGGAKRGGEEQCEDAAGGGTR
jgi:hypothetical protein